VCFRREGGKKRSQPCSVADTIIALSISVSTLFFLSVYLLNSLLPISLSLLPSLVSIPLSSLSLSLSVRLSLSLSLSRGDSGGRLYFFPTCIEGIKFHPDLHRFTARKFHLSLQFLICTMACFYSLFWICPGRRSRYIDSGSRGLGGCFYNVTL
jgi:hypothetical protein